MDAKNIMQHLHDHQSYPATREELVAECDELSDFSEEDKQWFRSKLPDRTYNSAQEVMDALGMKAEAGM